MNEWEFYKELGRVPGPPPYLYDSIRKKIQHRALVSRSLYALAATLLLTLGTTGYIVHRNSEASLAPEVAEEVQILNEYASGSDLNQESLANALYNGEVQSKDDR